MRQSSTSKGNTPTTPGHLGQVDIWGPYPVGRSGYTHFFTIIDAYTEYAVSVPCKNKPSEISKLLKQILGIFLSHGVKLEMNVGDSAFNTVTCKMFYTPFMETLREPNSA